MSPSVSAILALAVTFISTAQADVVATTPPSGFDGQQTGIGSWFQADIGRDSTNGHSWCGYPYKDEDPLFAPSLTVMGTATSGSAWTEAIQKWCGLEAKVTNPKTGVSGLMYIGDSFDPKWVKTPGSIDIIIGNYTNLAGHNPGTNKNDVIMGIRWELTGNVNTAWQAPGATRPSGSTANNVDVTDTTKNKVALAKSPTTLKKATKTGTASGSSNSGAGCIWGCWGWDCKADAPCRSPWQCRGGYCKA